MTDEIKFLLMPEVSEITRMSLDTLRYLRLKGEGPPSFRLGKRVVYPETELRAWIRAQAEGDTAAVRATA